MVEIKLSEEEINYLIECLLFSTGCDVCSDWDKNDIDSMFDLANKLKEQNLDYDLKNIYVHNPLVEENEKYWDSMTSKIVSFFPKILKHNI